MNVRELFLRALAEDENDTTSRLIYADWLEEHEEYEEADHQRRWVAARQWLLRLCQPSSDQDSDYDSFSYEDLIAFGDQAAEDTPTEVYLCDDSMRIWNAVKGDLDEFFQNWSVVTGSPLPRGLEYNDYYWQCCAHEVNWVGGVSPPWQEEERPEQELPEWDEWDQIQDDLSHIRRRDQ